MDIWVAVSPQVDQLTEVMPNFWRAVYVFNVHFSRPFRCQIIRRTSGWNMLIHAYHLPFIEILYYFMSINISVEIWLICSAFAVLNKPTIVITMTTAD